MKIYVSSETKQVLENKLDLNTFQCQEFCSTNKIDHSPQRVDPTKKHEKSLVSMKVYFHVFMFFTPYLILYILETRFENIHAP